MLPTRGRHVPLLRTIDSFFFCSTKASWPWTSSYPSDLDPRTLQPFRRRSESLPISPLGVAPSRPWFPPHRVLARTINFGPFFVGQGFLPADWRSVFLFSCCLHPSPVFTPCWFAVPCVTSVWLHVLSLEPFLASRVALAAWPVA